MTDHGSTKIGAIIRQARRAAGLTQGEMARKLGITQSSLCRVERGQRPLGFDLLEYLERFGVAVIFRSSKNHPPS